MKTNKQKTLSDSLTEKYGIPVSVFEESDSGNNKAYSIFPDDLHLNEGLSICINLGWRSITSTLVFGKFAGPLIEELGNSDDTMKQNFCLLTKKLNDEGAQIKFNINNSPYDVISCQQWPRCKWNKVELSLVRSPIMYSTDDIDEVDSLVLNWGGRLFGCVLCLLPFEETSSETADMYYEPLPEGAKTTITVNKYERSKLNRAACIDYYGNACKACGVQFEKLYGEIGKDFIHVHHITPLSSLGPNYKVDPIKDLVPVCPNCHYMLHRKDPPLTVEELSIALKKAKK